MFAGILWLFIGINSIASYLNLMHNVNAYADDVKKSGVAHTAVL
jgi:hypothetical protein